MGKTKRKGYDNASHRIYMYKKWAKTYVMVDGGED